MCLAVVALNAHPRHLAMLAANRDEFHARAAEPAHWWASPRILAGRDRSAGGTWLGVTPQGRYAFVTNVREPGRHDPAAPTRGTLVPRVLADRAPVDAAVRAAVADGAAMNGFNLLAGDASGAVWASNRTGDTRRIAQGIHALSNAALDTPWPKLVRTRAAVARWARAAAEAPLARGDGDADVEALFAILGDARCADDAELPRTGVPLEWERRLSAPFIVSPSYGTRCSTVVLLGRDGTVRFVERSFDPQGRQSGEVDVTFAIEPAGRPREGAHAGPPVLPALP
jgi:uncharacterized protein with NRDE domain